MDKHPDKIIDTFEEYAGIVYKVLTRYREIMGKKVYTEKPKTDFQAAMQELEKFYTRNVKE